MAKRNLLSRDYSGFPPGQTPRCEAHLGWATVTFYGGGRATVFSGMNLWKGRVRGNGAIARTTLALGKHAHDRKFVSDAIREAKASCRRRAGK